MADQVKKLPDKGPGGMPGDGAGRIDPVAPTPDNIKVDTDYNESGHSEIIPPPRLQRDERPKDVKPE